MRLRKQGGKMKNKLFESENFTGMIYLVTIIVCILILFSFVSLAESLAKKINETGKQEPQISRTTALAIFEDEKTKSLYSKQAYGYFYLFVTFILISIFFIIFLLFKKKK